MVNSSYHDEFPIGDRLWWSHHIIMKTSTWQSPTDDNVPPLISDCVCWRPSWTPKTQLIGSSAVVWFSFWCSTRFIRTTARRAWTPGRFSKVATRGFLLSFFFLLTFALTLNPLFFSRFSFLICTFFFFLLLLILFLCSYILCFSFRFTFFFFNLYFFFFFLGSYVEYLFFFSRFFFSLIICIFFFFILFLFPLIL